MKIRRFWLLVSIIGFAAVNVRADILTNAGFETGDFTGWTVFRPAPGQFGGTPIYGVATAGTVIPGTSTTFGTMDVIAHSGTYAGYAVVCQTHPCSGSGDVATDYLELSQVVSLVPGTTYIVGFWFGDPINMFLNDGASISIDGASITYTSKPSQLRPGYNLIEGKFTDTLTNPTISFFIQGSGSGHAGLSFDDFHLNPASVPEPSSLLMLGTGLVALAWMVRRKFFYGFQFHAVFGNPGRQPLLSRPILLSRSPR